MLSVAAAVPAAGPAQTSQDVLPGATGATHDAGATASVASLEASAEDSDSEAEADMLAQLSRSMWAALRPKMRQPQNKNAAQQYADIDTAEPDSFAQVQPKDLQAAGEQRLDHAVDIVCKQMPEHLY